VRPSALLIFTVGLRSAAATNIQFYSDFVVWVLKADPIKLSNTLQPNACQYVKVGAAVQKIGANQFHRDCTTHASRKLNANNRIAANKQQPVLPSLELYIFNNVFISSN
jgi:hypothetical protein